MKRRKKVIKRIKKGMVDDRIVKTRFQLVNVEFHNVFEEFDF